MKLSRTHKRCNSNEIATMKAQWHSQMEQIDRLYAEKFHLERHQLKGLHMVNGLIAKLATSQIALDYKIQQYHIAKNEYLYNQFLLHKSNQL